ncbi:bile acid:sodium symporter [Erythrobacter sp. SCSIO 43205]|uniref:bile acid:sodium symporter family protein n=1 Tax=Erythrobacter sp. SCSIO 43205 TaxID=2779361 RepID=UPI001CA87C41|nr:bile acid:sodium symporter family protein [Erythrobacter sp. SCSIO 43205]UAB77030.1 bile acid:sodium symporter [Erythrobacter sp. SCSIO 43205]
MLSRLSILADPMIVVLITATLLASVVPAAGEARGIAQSVSNVAIFLLFLVNGMRIARGEIAKGLANWRFFVPLFAWVFGAMALIGLGLSHIASGLLPPLVALGFLFLGALPSTIQSATSYTSLAGGNVALSVVGAALINIAGVFITAPLFAALAGGEAVDVGSETIVRIGTILILPFVIGQAVQGWTIKWLTTRKSDVAWLDRIVIGIAVYVAFSGAVEQGLGQMFTLLGWAALIGLVMVYLCAASGGAWLTGGLLNIARADRIAFLFAGAQKSVAIGAPLAAILFAPDVAGFVIAPLLLYHLLQLIIAAPLASLLARNSSVPSP